MRYMNGYEIVPKHKSLGMKNPELLKEWDRVKNIGIEPFQISPGSRLKVGWKCEQGHHWMAPVYVRTNGHGCKKCAAKRSAVLKVVPRQCSFGYLYPHLEAEWDYQKNKEVDPFTISPGTHLEVWWKCSNGHEWKTEVRARVRGNGCAVCSRRKIVKENSILVTNPEIIPEFHPTLNKGIMLSSLARGTQQRVWWKCPKHPEHEWIAAVCNRAKGQKCPFCAGKKVTVENSIYMTRPKLMKEWDWERNTGNDPKKLSSGSRRRAHWICEKGHRWTVAIGDRNRRESCPHCAKARQTSFPEQALFFYLRQLWPAENRAKKGVYEMDIFLSSLALAIEYDGSYFHPKWKRGWEEEKDAFWNSCGIQVIRVKEGEVNRVDKKRNIIWCKRKSSNYHVEFIWGKLLEMITDLTGYSPELPIQCCIKNDRKKIWDLYK